MALGFAFALTGAYLLEDPGLAFWTPISVMLLAGLSMGHQEGRAILKARDELLHLDPLSMVAVHAIVEKHVEHRWLYAGLRVVFVGAILAVIVYLDTSIGAAMGSFFVFQLAFHAIRLPGIVNLDRYARNRLALAAT
jgi:hypothetical protein